MGPKVRVRCEFYATRDAKTGGIAVRTDRKLLMLNVLLGERFGEAGLKLYRDWLELASANSSKARGGRDGR
jgi:hypothetical protein